MIVSAKSAGRTCVYGASDDLLEFSGAIYDELDIDNGHPWRVSFSHGPVLLLRADRAGVWRFRLAEEARGPAELEVYTARGEDYDDDEDGCPGYSDKVVLDVPAGTSVEVVRL